MSIKENYYKKANNLIERLEPEFTEEPDFSPQKTDPDTLEIGDTVIVNIPTKNLGDTTGTIEDIYEENGIEYAIVKWSIFDEPARWETRYLTKINKTAEEETSAEEAIEPEDIDRRPDDVAGNTRRVTKSPKNKYEIDEEGDIATETAKAMLSTYIDRCVEEGTKELGEEFGLEDIEGSYEIVQGEIERIAEQLKNYLKKGVQ